MFALENSKLFSQNFTVLNGYGAFIYFGSSWVFCPSDSLNTDLFKCRFEESFVLDIVPETFGIEKLPDSQIGDTICVILNDKYLEDNCFHKQNIVYFFGKLKYKIREFSNHPMSIECKYFIVEGYNEYKAACIYTKNSVLEIKPTKKNNKIAYVNYLKRMGYKLPAWASELNIE